MKLKEYVEKLVELAKEYPDLEVVYASDEEGNAFYKIFNDASIGVFNVSADSFREIDDGERHNAVCIN